MNETLSFSSTETEASASRTDTAELSPFLFFLQQSENSANLQEQVAWEVMAELRF